MQQIRLRLRFKPLLLPGRLPARREERAKWIIFFKKRVLFEWFRDR